MITIQLVLLVIAAICFMAHAVATNARVNLESLGLFFLTLAFIVEGLT